MLNKILYRCERKFYLKTCALEYLHFFRCNSELKIRHNADFSDKNSSFKFLSDNDQQGVHPNLMSFNYPKNYATEHIFSFDLFTVCDCLTENK